LVGVEEKHEHACSRRCGFRAEIYIMTFYMGSDFNTILDSIGSEKKKVTFTSLKYSWNSAFFPELYN